MYNNYYENMFLLDNSSDYIWWKTDRKKELNQLEKIGLENVLNDFVKDYENNVYSENYVNIIDYTRWNQDNVDILDGYYDTYIFDNYAIGEIYCTNNGIILLDCIDLRTYENKENDTDYQDLINDGDYQGIVSKYDIFGDFELVTFRLN